MQEQAAHVHARPPPAALTKSSHLFTRKVGARRQQPLHFHAAQPQHSLQLVRLDRGGSLLQGRGVGAAPRPWKPYLPAAAAG